MSNPFLFSNSDKSEQKLLKRLENIGFVFISSSQEYRQRIWEMNFVWNPEHKIKLIWEQDWVADGVLREDVGFSFVVDDCPIKSFQIFGCDRDTIINKSNKGTGTN